jgi:hypothetical protein
VTPLAPLELELELGHGLELAGPPIPGTNTLIAKQLQAAISPPVLPLQASRNGAGHPVVFH